MGRLCPPTVLFLCVFRAVFQLLIPLAAVYLPLGRGRRKTDSETSVWVRHRNTYKPIFSGIFRVREWPKRRNNNNMYNQQDAHSRPGLPVVFAEVGVRTG